MLAGGAVAAAIGVGWKLSRVRPPDPAIKSQDYTDLATAASVAARAGIESTENHLSPTYVIRHYGDVTHEFIKGKPEKFKEYWSSFFNYRDQSDNYDFVRTKNKSQEQGINFDGERTPFPNLNTINTTLLPLITMLKGGLSAGKALTIKTIADGKFSPGTINLAPFAPLFLNAVATAFDAPWQKQLLTYDQVWTTKVPLMICNFLSSIVDWQQVAASYPSWTIPIHHLHLFDLKKDNYDFQTFATSNQFTQVNQLVRIVIDDLVLRKTHCLKPTAKMFQSAATIKTTIELVWFVASYAHEFLSCDDKPPSPPDQTHLFSKSKTNQAVHQKVGQMVYRPVAAVDFQELSELVDALLVTHPRDQSDYLNKLKFWNILFANHDGKWKPEPHASYKDEHLGIVEALGKHPLELDWTDIKSRFPGLTTNDNNLVHGLDGVWRAFAAPVATQFLVSSADLQRHFHQEIKWFIIKATVDIPDIWRSIWGIFNHLHLGTVPAQLLDQLSKNDPDITNWAQDCEQLVTDALNLISKPIFKALSFKISLDKVVSVVKKLEPIIQNKVKKNVETLVKDLKQHHQAELLMGSFKSLYKEPSTGDKPNVLAIFSKLFGQQKNLNLRMLLDQKINLGQDPLLYYWHQTSISKLARFLVQLLHPAAHQTAKIETIKLQQLIQSLAFDAPTWAQKHPDLYDFREEGKEDPRKGLKGKSVLQYAIMLWNESSQPSSGQQVGIDGAFAALGLQPTVQLEGESVLSRLSALYDGQGVDRMLDGTIKILETMRLGMHQNERVNYLPLLTEKLFVV